MRKSKDLKLRNEVMKLQKELFEMSENPNLEEQLRNLQRLRQIDIRLQKIFEKIVNEPGPVNQKIIFNDIN